MRLFRELFGIAVVAFATLATGCQKPIDNEQPLPGMAVTYYTIDGAWQLDTWNGEALAEGTALYIEFSQKERRFEMWDNLNSMYMVETTGNFAITQDEYERYVLSGWYDYGVGDWASDYSVTMNTSGEYMFWIKIIGNDQSIENSENMVFKRIDSIPAF